MIDTAKNHALSEFDSAEGALDFAVEIRRADARPEVMNVLSNHFSVKLFAELRAVIGDDDFISAKLNTAALPQMAHSLRNNCKA